MVDGAVVSRAKQLGFDANQFLSNNDSNTFFKKFGGLLVTGPTGTNMNDIIIAVALPNNPSEEVLSPHEKR